MPAGWARWFEERLGVAQCPHSERQTGKTGSGSRPFSCRSIHDRTRQLLWVRTAAVPNLWAASLLEQRGTCQAMMPGLCAAGAKGHPCGGWIPPIRRWPKNAPSGRLIVGRWSGFAQDSLHTRDWKAAHEFMCDLDPHSHAGQQFLNVGEVFDGFPWQVVNLRICLTRPLPSAVRE